MTHSNALEQRPGPWPMGPFEHEPIGNRAPGVWPVPGAPHKPWNRERMEEVLAGVELGAYDLRILEWLTDWEPSTLAVVAGWIKRARRDAGAECPGCDRLGRDIWQETNGDLVCHRCGRMVVSAEDADVS